MTKPIQIKKEEVAQNIRELAVLMGEAITDAVNEAVLEKLAKVRKRLDVEERRAKVNRVLAEIDALPRIGPPLTDDELYDEHGLPK